MLGFLITFFLASSAWAFPTSTIWIPNDITEPLQTFRLDSRVFFTLDNRSTDTTTQSPFVDEGLTYGFYDNAVVGIEGGLDWWSPVYQDDLEALHANFKVSVHEKDNFPSFTLGFYNFGFKAETTDENILYLGLGKTFGAVGHFFGAYSVGNSNVLVNDTGSMANKAFMLSYENPTPFPGISRKLSILADYQSSFSQEGALSFGFQWHLESDTTLLLGYDIYNDRDISRDTMNVQLEARL